MIKSQILRNKLDLITIYSLYLLAFCIPFGFHLINIFIIIPGVILLIKFILFREELVLTQKAVLGIIVSYYLFHFVGLIYSDDLDKGISNILKKFNLLLIPLIINTNIKRLAPRISCILIFFTAGVGTAMVVSLSMASVLFFSTGDSSGFFYHDLSKFLNQHSTYFSIEVAFASLLILFFLKDRIKQIKPFTLLGLIALFLCFQLFLLLLSSKSILFVYGLLINFLLFFYISKKSFWKATAGMLFFNLLFIVILVSVPHTNERFKEIWSLNFEAVTQKEYTITTKFTAFTFRATIWKFLVQNMSEKNNWVLGEGTGDWQAELEKEYVKNKVFLGIKDQRNANGFLGANAHNQYLQALLMLGVIGLTLLLLSFLVPVYFSIKDKNYLFLIFITFILSCSLFESSLETSKCILFYSFFNSLLYFGNYRNILTRNPEPLNQAIISHHN